MTVEQLEALKDLYKIRVELFKITDFKSERVFNKNKAKLLEFGEMLQKEGNKLKG